MLKQVPLRVMFSLNRSGLVLAGVLALAIPATADQLRVATWNISNYDGVDRAAALQNSLFSSFGGRFFRPDVLFTQEILSTDAANTLKSVMNSASGSAGDYDFVLGSVGSNDSSGTAMFYRTSQVTSMAPSLVAAAGGTSANPRDVFRFDFTINNNLASQEIFSVYNLHMKAGNGTVDQDRRNVEAGLVRNNANNLSLQHHIMVMGDFNMQSSSQDAFQTLTGAGSNSRGQVLDPIASSGSWQNNEDFKFIHTQDPAGAGGMDDRYDMILMDASFADATGTEYTGNFGTTFSSSTWNDANHSYRTWGNDGTSFNTTLTTSGNSMVGASIAQSLIDVADGSGHLPVYLDLTYDPVPEPATLGLLGLGLAGLVTRRKLKK